MNALKIAVAVLLLLPLTAHAERIAATLGQMVDAANLIATGELVDLKRIDIPPPAQSNNLSLNSAKPLRWEATFRIDAVLMGSFKRGNSIRVAGFEYPLSLDGPVDFNRLPRTGSIWFFTREKRGVFTVVRGDAVMVDSADTRAEINHYLRSKNGLNELFKATTASQVHAGIRRGIDVNAQDYYGRTALDVAINHDRIEVVRALLDGGAKLDLAVINPLDLAIDLGRAPIIELLKSRGARANGLFLLYEKSLQEYAFFLAQGADVNAGIRAGYTPIGRILERPEPDARAKISWLLDHGAFASLPNGSRTQPLIEAIYCNNAIDVAELLLHHRAEVNATDDRGWTALTAALGCTPTIATLELLISHGATAKVVDSSGWTPLFRYLVGRTPEASPAVVQSLLDAGADPRVVVASHGKNAIDLANDCSSWSENCRQIAKLLNEHRD